MKRLLAPLLLAALGACTDSATGEGQGCDGPPKGWHRPAEGIGELMPIERVRVRGDGVVAWNGEPVSVAALADFLHRSASANPRPMILFSFDSGTACPAVRDARRVLRASPSCRAGLCGEGSGWRYYPGGEIVF
ncbi:hypothetical protein JMG10_16865 [Nostoc ellipsosporum NOK]|uniref:ExbD/TolR family protein n=1 Tax=Sphingomonas sp. IBVSS2 TaxID=1985172 RepID=UPI000A2E12E9|nr:hypothetical protein [Sphingomonas sp. IBVSS2]MDF2383158.1 hypothetical protein [Nostoc ellipsosporum NOK]OSZ69535.1 hypothetical protein CAP40_01355 [Sphingomonas sp. IBVSS2]